MPDWASLGLTITRLDVEGRDSVTRERWSATAFDGSRALTIPRSAEDSPRLLVAGETPAGVLDQVFITLESATLTKQGGGTATLAKRAVLRLVPTPSEQIAGATQSLVIRAEIGTNILLPRPDTLRITPAFRAATLEVLTPENYLDGDEDVSTQTTQTFPELDVEVVRAKIFDAAAGDIRDLTLRTDTGEPVSFSELRAENDALWRQTHGALEPALVSALAPLAGTDVVQADVWLDVPGGPSTLVTDASTPEDWDAAHAAFVDARRAAAAPIAAQIAADLTGAGATVLAVDLHPPVLHISASRALLEGAVAFHSEILEVARTPLASERSVFSTPAAADLVQEPLQLAHLLGAGQGLRIALTEDLACVDTDHQAFQGVVFEEPVSMCHATLGTQAHAGHSTAVAGALAAFVPDDPTNTTLPPPGLVGLFQGRMFTADLCGATSEALLARNPHLMNVSCASGLIGANEPVDLSGKQYLDAAVYEDRIFVATGAGNLSAGDDGAQFPVLCPAYNAVCVGGYFHTSTVGPELFGDDVLTHRYSNNPATQRELPDLVGPSSAKLPSASIAAMKKGYVTFGGTSFSTPFVVGTAALLMANFPQHLLNDPTLTRAVLMASARHSFAGQPTAPLHNDAIDDRAGAGAPRGDIARDVLQDEDFLSGLVTPADFNATGYLAQPPPSFQVTEGDRVRVVLTYDQCQVGTTTSPDLLADLDLLVRFDALPTPNYFVNSSHVDNTEIIDFTALTPGTVHVNARVQHWDPCSNGVRQTHMAIAWHVLEGDIVVAP